MCQVQSYPCPPHPGYAHAPFHHGCGCGRDTLMVSPYELSVASGGPSAQALVGGASTVHLSLEYLVDTGASSPSIKVTTASDGTSSTWQETTPATGYQFRRDFMNVPPGTTVTVDATEMAARLRWCETFCC